MRGREALVIHPIPHARYHNGCRLRGMTPEERVQQALNALGLPARVVQFEASTGTAAAAAATVGCDLGQIVKSLFFLAESRPTLVLVAGDRQADTARLAELLGTSRKQLKMGAPGEVLAATGYPIGGVAPVGSFTPCDVVADASLRRFETVWAAAGSCHAVFEVDPGALVEKVCGQWAAITRE
jgi:prolyl-tRNA editing enzyme YbaK/EbsC (Cys-tRNA(Pro) deacylase)